MVESTTPARRIVLCSCMVNAPPLVVSLQPSTVAVERARDLHCRLKPDSFPEQMDRTGFWPMKRAHPCEGGGCCGGLVDGNGRWPRPSCGPWTRAILGIPSVSVRMVSGGRSPTGRGRALKPSPVRVRIPPPPLGIRAPMQARRQDGRDPGQMGIVTLLAGSVPNWGDAAGTLRATRDRCRISSSHFRSH